MSALSYYNRRRQKEGKIPRIRVSAKVAVRLLWGVFTVIVVGVVALIGLLVYVGRDLPSPDRLVRREGFATKIYDRNGKLLYDVYVNERRTPLEIGQIPEVVKQATIAIEDKSFYEHSGVDPLTPLRIVANLVFRQRIVGGSTLTQQLIKNRFFTNERNISRKIREFILALQVEAKYSKEQILQMYLNEVPYGGTAYGIQAAAEAFFGKQVADLTLEEAAILAGLPQSPSRYSPHAGRLYIARAQDVLRRMREDGYISSEREKEALEKLPEVKISDRAGILEAPHFVFYVRDILVGRYGEQVVESGGLRVHTTLDLDLQKSVQAAVTEEIDKVRHLRISNGAAVVMDTSNGQILAMVGSRGWSDENIDGKFNVATALRQPGSAIKPVTYLAGLAKGYTAATMLMDVKTVFPGGDKPEYVPENYDGKYRGPVLVREALGNSLNVPAVKMLALVGIKEMLQLAYEMGFKTLEPTPDFLKRVGLAVTLGGGEVRLLEMTAAYSAFANGGNKVEPVAILKVTDANGKVLEQWRQQPPVAVITPGQAHIISSILSDPAARSLTFGAATSLTVPGKTTAVKTGTTNDRRDNWTVGWSASGRIAGVWVGNNDNSPMRQVASGITGASPIWKRVMTAALKDLPNVAFATPSGVVVRDVDRISGWPAHSNFPSRPELFLEGTVPTGEDPIHKLIKVCKGEGKLATPADVNSGNFETREAIYLVEEDPFEAQMKSNRWQEGILNWLKDQQDLKYRPPTEYCGSTSSIWITVLEPIDKSRTASDDVLVRLRIDDVNKISTVKIFLNKELKYVLNSEPWEIVLPNVPKGKHILEIEAVNEKGQVGSRLLNISVGEDWEG